MIVAAVMIINRLVVYVKKQNFEIFKKVLSFMADPKELVGSEYKGYFFAGRGVMVKIPNPSTDDSDARSPVSKWTSNH